MRVPGSRTLRRIARQIRNRLAQPPLILLYHRVITLDADPWEVCVTQSNFEEHLQVLRDFRDPVSLVDLIDALDAGNTPRGAVAVTFDDGYRDNLKIAKPLLERYDIPATWFLATGALASDREFWWDELESILIGLGEFPALPELGTGGTIKGSDLSSLYEQLRPMSEEYQQDTLARLREIVGTNPKPRDSHRTLSLEEVTEAAADDLIDIGSHTVTHPLLASQPIERQRDEIVRSKHFLEELLNSPVRGFAYPHGGRHDYSADSVQLVREAGYAYACAAFEGTVGRDSDRHQLPRINVGNWDGEQFARRLAVGFGA